MSRKRGWILHCVSLWQNDTWFSFCQAWFYVSITWWASHGDLLTAWSTGLMVGWSTCFDSTSLTGQFVDSLLVTNILDAHHCPFVMLSNWLRLQPSVPFFFYLLKLLLPYHNFVFELRNYFLISFSLHLHMLPPVWCHCSHVTWVSLGCNKGLGSNIQILKVQYVEYGGEL